MPIIAQNRAPGKPGDIPAPREGLLGRIPEGALTATVVVLASAGSFGLGMLFERETGQGSDKIRIEGVSAEEESATLPAATLSAAVVAAPTVSAASAPAVSAPAVEGGGQYVASKSGKSYHLPWCAGAKQIKESNKIYFASKAEAEAAGYSPAKNCKGI